MATYRSAFEPISGCDILTFDTDIVPSGLPLCTVPTFVEPTMVPAVFEMNIPDIAPPPFCPEIMVTSTGTGTIDISGPDGVAAQMLVIFDLEINDDPCKPEIAGEIEISIHISIPSGGSDIPEGDNIGDMLIWDGDDWELLEVPDGPAFVGHDDAEGVHWVSLANTYMMPQHGDDDSVTGDWPRFHGG